MQMDMEGQWRSIRTALPKWCLEDERCDVQFHIIIAVVDCLHNYKHTPARWIWGHVPPPLPPPSPRKIFLLKENLQIRCMCSGIGSEAISGPKNDTRYFQTLYNPVWK